MPLWFFYGKEYFYNCKLASKEHPTLMAFYNCALYFKGPEDLVDTLVNKDISKMSIAQLQEEKEKTNKIVSALHSNYAPFKTYKVDIYQELESRFPDSCLQYTVEINGHTAAQTDSEREICAIINTLPEKDKYLVYDYHGKLRPEFSKKDTPYDTK